MSKNNFSSEKRVGKSKAYKAEARQKAANQKLRHLDPKKRREDRRKAAENKKGYSKFVKKLTIRKFSEAKEGSVPSDKVRINKFLAQGGTCSRREAEKYIIAGAVKINGKVVTDLSYRVASSDLVKFYRLITVQYY